MARPKKKSANPQQSMEELLANTVALYSIPYDDRDGERDSELPSLRTVADQLGTTVLRVRKLLITAECVCVWKVKERYGKQTSLCLLW